MINGHFDGSTGWTLGGGAWVSGLYGHYPGGTQKEAAVITFYHGPGPDPATFEQMFSVEDGQVLRGRYVLH